MKAYQIIFLAVLALPFLEIYTLLAVGGIIGPLPTITLVVLTAVLGVWLLRKQGFATFQNLRANIEQGRVPAYEMVEGPIILLGGFLLLMPGFISDCLGFVCLVPQLRRKLAKYVIEHHLIQSGGFGGFETKQQPDALEGEFHRDED